MMMMMMLMVMVVMMMMKMQIKRKKMMMMWFRFVWDFSFGGRGGCCFLVLARYRLRVFEDSAGFRVSISKASQFQFRV